ncbi:hypothetical protein GCM10010331_32770 [Streptomyces xanthochromogenes]|uniref:Uncharacterized protein n=1 Tax=Streptomyces xanthochromogenes TaxID=67384 RepID=A0ABQ3A0Q7_9ACTN|nr:hypothetical protein GCM10010326_22940 [Streptomyces xanthochromogenes]GHB42774.1 hypothetical protein GCM10010331_32770 [Streptomyces xanthochromogenes]
MHPGTQTRQFGAQRASLGACHGDPESTAQLVPHQVRDDSGYAPLNGLNQVQDTQLPGGPRPLGSAGGVRSRRHARSLRSWRSKRKLNKNAAGLSPQCGRPRIPQGRRSGRRRSRMWRGPAVGNCNRIYNPVRS